MNNWNCQNYYISNQVYTILKSATVILYVYLAMHSLKIKSFGLKKVLNL